MRAADGAPWPALLANRRNTAATAALGPVRAGHRWTYSAGDTLSFSGPPIVDSGGTLYLGTGTSLIALSDRGELSWSLNTDGRAGVPAFDRAGDLVAGVHARGLLLVSRDGRERHLTERAFNEPCSPAVAADGTIYIAARGELCAFDGEGGTLWSAEVEGTPSRAPLIVPDGTVQLKSRDTFASQDDLSECFDNVTVWSQDGRHVKTSHSVSGYSVDGACWGSCRYGGDCAPLADERGASIVGLGKEIFVDAQRLAFAGTGPMALSPDGALLVGLSGSLVAMNLDGTIRWRAAIDGVASFPVIDGEGRVYCTRHDGRVLAFDRDGQLLWSWQIPSREPGMAVEYALAIGAKATLYVVAWDSIYALGEAA